MASVLTLLRLVLESDSLLEDRFAPHRSTYILPKGRRWYNAHLLLLSRMRVTFLVLLRRLVRPDQDRGDPLLLHYRCRSDGEFTTGAKSGRQAVQIGYGWGGSSSSLEGRFRRWRVGHATWTSRPRLNDRLATAATRCTAPARRGSYKCAADEHSRQAISSPPQTGGSQGYGPS